MIYFLITALGLLGILFPKSKVITFFIFSFMWLLWGWNTWNGDHDAYELMYDTIGKNNLSDSTVEFGYRFLNYLFYNMGFTFSQFMIIYSFLVLSIVFLFTIRCPFPAIFSVLYFVIFIMGYVFMRNYMADAMFFIFFILALSQSKRRQLKSIMVLVLSLFFHNTAFLYLIFLLVFADRLSIKGIFYITLVIIGIITTSLGFLISFIDSDLIKSKIEYYQSNVNPIGPAISHILVAISPILFLHLSKIKVSKTTEAYEKSLIVLQKINILSLIYIPMYFFIPDFSRFFRVLIPISIFFLLYLIFNFKNANAKVALTAIIIGIYLIALYQFSYSTLEFTFYPLFNSNSIFDRP